MPSEKLDELYAQLKDVGTKAESMLNAWVKEQLGREEVAGLVSMRSKKYARLMRDLQDAVEMASIPLNFPTKRDVANVAQLTIQNEDKLIAIEQEIAQVRQSLQRLEQALTTSPSYSSNVLPMTTPPQPTRAKQSKRPNDQRNLTSREEKAKKVRENLAKLSNALKSNGDTL